jgi:hypothetical protein
MQRVEELVDKVAQVRSKWEELEGNFHILAKAVKGACTTNVVWDEPHVSVGGLLGVGLF